MSTVLEETFDIEAPTHIQTEIITADNQVILPSLSTDQAIDYDYDKTRSNLHGLLVQGQEALSHALEVAKQSEHPRAFEVVGNLVKQLAEVNQQLLELSETHQKLKGKDAGQSSSPSHVTNNAFFVGSTHELNKLLKNATTGE